MFKYIFDFFMMEMITVLLVLGLIVALIRPWINLTRINAVRGELERLRREMRKLQDYYGASRLPGGATSRGELYTHSAVRHLC